MDNHHAKNKVYHNITYDFKHILILNFVKGD